MYWFWKIITWPFVRILCPCKLVGKENLPKGNAIYVCNHLSNFDVFYCFHYLNKKFNFLAKQELFNKKIKSTFLKQIGGIPINREKIDLKAIKTVLTLLKNKKNLMIFPEGTRNKNNTNLQEIKNGTAMFAIKTETQIVPLHIDKKGKILKRNKLLIGKSFELKEFYGKQTNNEILNKASEIIEKHMKI